MRGVGRLACFRGAIFSSTVSVEKFGLCRLLPSAEPNSAFANAFDYLSVLHPYSSFLSEPAGTKHFSTASSSLAEEINTRVCRQSTMVGKTVVLYQYEACPFCNKVRAFLDYYKIPYTIVEVNPLRKRELSWSAYKKVPILAVDQEQLVDSSDIIDKLFNMTYPSEASKPKNDEERKWRRWVDNHLVHLLAPNIYRTTFEALESFDYITTHGKFNIIDRIAAKYIGAAAMYFVSKKLKKKHNITDERQALYRAAEEWVDALGGRKFLGVSAPNLADLAVYGVLRPIRKLKSGEDLVEHTCIGDWYSHMDDVVGDSCVSRS